MPAPVPVLAQAQRALKTVRHVPLEEATDRRDAVPVVVCFQRDSPCIRLSFITCLSPPPLSLTLCTYIRSSCRRTARHYTIAHYSWTWKVTFPCPLISASPSSSLSWLDSPACASWPSLSRTSNSFAPRWSRVCSIVITTLHSSVCPSIRPLRSTTALQPGASSSAASVPCFTCRRATFPSKTVSMPGLMAPTEASPRWLCKFQGGAVGRW